VGVTTSTVRDAVRSRPAPSWMVAFTRTVPALVKVRSSDAVRLPSIVAFSTGVPPTVQTIRVSSASPGRTVAVNSAGRSLAIRRGPEMETSGTSAVPARTYMVSVSLRPSASVTVSVTVYRPGRSGTNAVRTHVRHDGRTVVPFGPVIRQLYSTMSPDAAREPPPSRSTRSPTVDSWSRPASANGASSRSTVEDGFANVAVVSEPVATSTSSSTLANFIFLEKQLSCLRL